MPGNVRAAGNPHRLGVDIAFHLQGTGNVDFFGRQIALCRGRAGHVYVLLANGVAIDLGAAGDVDGFVFAAREMAGARDARHARLGFFFHGFSSSSILLSTGA